MNTSIRAQKVSRMLQKVLGEILSRESASLLDNMMVTVTEVQVSPNLGLAKVYLSFVLNKKKENMLAKVQQKKSVLRKLLGNRIGSKLRKMPELCFYIDDSAAHATKIQQLLAQLDIPKEMAFSSM